MPKKLIRVDWSVALKEVDLATLSQKTGMKEIIGAVGPRWVIERGGGLHLVVVMLGLQEVIDYLGTEQAVARLGLSTVLTVLGS